MRRIARGRIGAKTLLLSDKAPRLPVVSANAADFPLINFLYYKLKDLSITGIPLVVYLNMAMAAAAILVTNVRFVAAANEN